MLIGNAERNKATNNQPWRACFIKIPHCFPCCSKEPPSAISSIFSKFSSKGMDSLLCCGPKTIQLFDQIFDSGLKAIKCLCVCVPTWGYVGYHGYNILSSPACILAKFQFEAQVNSSFKKQSLDKKICFPQPVDRDV